MNTLLETEPATLGYWEQRHLNRVRTARYRAGRGIEHLNALRPGWPALVDVGRLDMDSGFRCVLGQIWGSYIDAPVITAIVDAGGNGHRWAVEHGFNVFMPWHDEWAENEPSYANLNEVWVTEIRRLQAEAQ